MHDGTSEKYIINQRMFNYNIGQGIEKTMKCNVQVYIIFQLVRETYKN